MLVRVLMAEGEEQVEVPDGELIDFPRGIVGFEECNRYVLLPLDAPWSLLQAVDDPHVGFVVMDPTLLDRGYRAPLPPADRLLLRLASREQPQLLAIATLSTDGGSASVNLRAPVAINGEKRLGTQVILQDTPYPVHYALVLSPDGGVDLAASAVSHGSRHQRRTLPVGDCGRSLEAVRC